MGVRSGDSAETLSALRARWERREISNFEYLLRLNTLAGRSYHDLNQYPVMPWVLADYDSEKLDLSNPASFRDLSKPMGAQRPAQALQVAETYEAFDDPDLPKFHYGSHYSTLGFVLYYLIRLEPFSSYAVALQSGKLDLADRLFHSLGDTWRACIASPSDVKELTPEFYYLPHFLGNGNGLPLGARTSGEPLGDVLLPKWASSAADFVTQHRAALESEYVSAHLHEWVDLIFGFKQTGPEAVKALNVFFYLTYEGGCDLAKVGDVRELEALQAQLNNFGQTPSQLFVTPHPPR
ncbi:BEACH domain-containing protein, partial [Pavlovales sp. CCMP2436]